VDIHREVIVIIGGPKGGTDVGGEGFCKLIDVVETKSLIGKRFNQHSGGSKHFVNVGANVSQIYEDMTWVEPKLGGVYDIKKRSSYNLQLVEKNLLLEPDQDGLNTIDLLPVVEKFLAGAHLFDKGMLPKLGILNCGPAGTGKTHNINKVVSTLVGDGGMALYFAMDTTRTGDFITFLEGIKRPEGLKKLFIIIEDLGGGEADDRAFRIFGSDSSLLGLLDGNHLPWKDVPTILMSTTNHKRLFMANIIDRPGRFDEIYDFEYPDGLAIAKYVQRIIKGPLDDFAINSLKEGKLSVAHARLAAIKYLVYKTPIHLTVDAMRKHTKDIEDKLAAKLGPKQDEPK